MGPCWLTGVHGGVFNNLCSYLMMSYVKYIIYFRYHLMSSWSKCNKQHRSLSNASSFLNFQHTILKLQDNLDEMKRSEVVPASCEAHRWLHYPAVRYFPPCWWPSLEQTVTVFCVGATGAPSGQVLTDIALTVPTEESPLSFLALLCPLSITREAVQK